MTLSRVVGCVALGVRSPRHVIGSHSMMQCVRNQSCLTSLRQLSSPAVAMAASGGPQGVTPEMNGKCVFATGSDLVGAHAAFFPLPNSGSALHSCILPVRIRSNLIDLRLGPLKEHIQIGEVEEEELHVDGRRRFFP